MFALYSYIAPVVTEVGGLSEGAVPVFLLAFGLGMVVGTYVAGRARPTGRCSAPCSARRWRWPSCCWRSPCWPRPAGGHWLPAFLVAVASSVLVVNLQLRLMSVAGDAQTLGAAMNHSSLNIGNALGAWLGGLVIAAGWGYRAPSLIGVVLALAGVGGAAALGVGSPTHRDRRRLSGQSPGSRQMPPCCCGSGITSKSDVST